MARHARKQAPLDTLRGELLDFRVRSADFWGTGTLRSKHDGGDLTITGKLLGVKPGDHVELEGTFDAHPKYGRQFKVRECRVVVPQDASGVVGWLAAKLPQVSARRAEQMVERWGVDGVWAILDGRRTDELASIEGITPARASIIIDHYHANKADRDRVVRLKSWGMTDSQIARVVATWGDEAEDRIAANPYVLMEYVDGFGWARADAVAKRMGLPFDAPQRIAAGLMHVLGEAVFAGHCFVPDAKLVALVSDARTCDVATDKVWPVLEQLAGAGKVVRLGTGVYLPKIAGAEERLARAFATRAQKAREGRAA